MSSSDRVAVIGAAGQLGIDISRAFRTAGTPLLALSHDDAEVTDPLQIQKVIEAHRPGVVVNCAAFHTVEACEDVPQTAFAVNAVGALNVARACAKVDAVCVQISTDYVFDGEKDGPYEESDSPRPLNVYGTSKLAGENLVQQACPQSLVVRVASLFGRAGVSGKGGNFVETILKRARAGQAVRVVDDQVISPTYARDAAEVICRLVEGGARGVVHVTNLGSAPCTWYDLAKQAVDLCKLPTKVEPIASSEYPSKARRPPNSALDSTRAARLTGRLVPPWDDALGRYLREKGYIT